MNYRFNFRDENNKFVKSGNWDAIKKIDFASTEINKNVVSNITSWLNHDFSITKEKKISWIKQVIEKMNADKRSNLYIEKFLKSYINSSLSLKNICPCENYKRVVANGTDKYWG